MKNEIISIIDVTREDIDVIDAYTGCGAWVEFTSQIAIETNLLYAKLIVDTFLYRAGVKRAGISGKNKIKRGSRS